MKRRAFLSMAAAVATMLMLAFTAGAGSARAQQNLNCCTYTINALNTIPAGCFPITIETEWGAGVRKVFVVGGPGVFLDGIPAPAPCPPALPFNWVRVLPNGPFVVLGATGTIVLPCGYTLTYAPRLDANGCIYIVLF